MAKSMMWNEICGRPHRRFRNPSADRCRFLRVVRAFRPPPGTKRYIYSALVQSDFVSFPFYLPKTIWSIDILNTALFKCPRAFELPIFSATIYRYLFFKILYSNTERFCWRVKINPENRTPKISKVSTFFDRYEWYTRFLFQSTFFFF